jgi:hypothetical protein
MGLKVGIVGVGSFAQCFIPLYKAHPIAGEVVLCDVDAANASAIPRSSACRSIGTQGSFEQGCAGAMWLAKDAEQCMRLAELLRCREIPAGPDATTTNPTTCYRDVSDVHPLARLPREFRGLTDRHGGSHQFLVDDFVRACVTGRQPPISVWQAARYTVPRIVAHESALRGGALLPVPDFGALPAPHASV